MLFGLVFVLELYYFGNLDREVTHTSLCHFILSVALSTILVYKVLISVGNSALETNCCVLLKLCVPRT